MSELRICVVVPTFNEAKNIQHLIERVFAQLSRFSLPVDLSLLVVDDHSPDQTSEVVRGLMPKFNGLHLIERMDKGRGTAGIVGFAWALKLDAEVIIEMDADFSHPPEDLPKMVHAIVNTDSDIVIASRLTPGSRDLRPWRRRAVTRFANWYARFFLQRSFHLSRVQDWTTGYRAYRRRVFEKIPPEALISRGPSLLQEILFRALNAGFKASEFCFEMKDRVQGESTFSKKVALQSLLSIPAYRLLLASEKEVFALSRYRVIGDGSRDLRLELERRGKKAA